MVYLITSGRLWGLAGIEEVRVPYATLEEAQAQAAQEQAAGKPPLRIEDADTQDVLWSASRDVPLSP
jgi:hypothetical protein